MSSAVTPSEHENMVALGEQIDVFFMMFCNVLVFMMLPGFTFLEAGAVRPNNVKTIVLKNLIAMVATVVGFLVVGFTFSSGETRGGAIGWTWWQRSAVSTPALFLSAALFACTSATIFSGAVAERIHIPFFAFLTAIYSIAVYPLLGHWCWNEGGWLLEMGYHDFAGSGVVHLSGGVYALIVCKHLGPRIGRFSGEKPNLSIHDIPGHSLLMQAMGVWLLLIGFLGFNASSTYGVSDGRGVTAAKAMLNTVISICVGSATTTLIGIVRSGTFDVSVSLNGALAGCVSVTAIAGSANQFGAAVTSVVGALVLHQSSKMLLNNFSIDDPVDAIPVHGFCGAWGVLGAGFISDQFGLLYTGDWAFLGAQIVGILAIVGWTSFVALVSIRVGEKMGLTLRITDASERLGCDSVLSGSASYNFTIHGEDLSLEDRTRKLVQSFMTELTPHPLQSDAPVTTRTADEMEREKFRLQAAREMTVHGGSSTDAQRNKILTTTMEELHQPMVAISVLAQNLRDQHVTTIFDEDDEDHDGLPAEEQARVMREMALLSSQCGFAVAAASIASNVLNHDRVLGSEVIDLLKLLSLTVSQRTITEMPFNIKMSSSIKSKYMLGDQDVIRLFFLYATVVTSRNCPPGASVDVDLTLSRGHSKRLLLVRFTQNAPLGSSAAPAIDAVADTELQRGFLGLVAMQALAELIGGTFGIDRLDPIRVRVWMMISPGAAGSWTATRTSQTTTSPSSALQSPVHGHDDMWDSHVRLGSALETAAGIDTHTPSKIHPDVHSDGDVAIVNVSMPATLVSSPRAAAAFGSPPQFTTIREATTETETEIGDVELIGQDDGDNDDGGKHAADGSGNVDGGESGDGSKEHWKDKPMLQRVRGYIRIYISRMFQNVRQRGPGGMPPRLAFTNFLFAFLGILPIALLNYLSGMQINGVDNVVILGSFGAGATLVFDAYRSPLAQPRNLIGGQLVSALIGVSVRRVMFDEAPYIAAALAVGLAIGVMDLTGTTHPPGGASALIAVIGGPNIVKLGYWYVLCPVGLGSVILLVMGMLLNNLQKSRPYPSFWF